MKAILFTLIIVCLLSCTDITHTHMSLLDDRTESVKPKSLHPYSILEYYTDDIYGSKSFSYKAITDVVHSKTYTHTLKSENYWLSNALDRKASLQGFYGGIKSQLNFGDSMNWGYDISPIWETVVLQLSNLQKPKTKTKGEYILILRSDLRQNSALHNSYKDRGLSKTQLVYRYLTWAKIKGIVHSENHPKLIIWYTPKTKEADTHFTDMSSVYQSVCDSLNILLEFKYQ